MKTTTLILLSLAALAGPACALNDMTRVALYTGEGTNNSFGCGLTMGDFDADGRAEYIIGAIGWNSNAGKNYYYDWQGEWLQSPTWTFQGPDSTWYGYWYYDWVDANVGDVSGDGIDDFGIVQGMNVGNSRLDLLFGGADFDSLADWSMGSGEWVPTFAFPLDSCGDVNGDGGMDFCFSLGPYIGGWDGNETRIYFGGAALDTIPDWIIQRLYGFTFIEGLGDINGDGFADVLVTVPDGSHSGLIYFGGSPMDTLSDLTFLDIVAAGGGCGDLNGDGVNDFCLDIKEPGSSTFYGKVYLGGPEVNATPWAVLKNRLGNPCGTLNVIGGNFNGDGYSDIAAQIGDPYYGLAVGIYLGSSEFNGTLDALVSDVSIWNAFGRTMASGDVDGDGCDELLVGAPDAYSPSDIGQAHLFTGPDNWIDYGAVVVIEDLQRHPEGFLLTQNFPNPFNSSTSIHFELARASTVNLTIYDLRGQKITQLIVCHAMLPGGYNVSWNGKNEQNQQVSSGIYLLVLKVDQYRQMKKMVLIQ